MLTVSVHEAETNLSELLQYVASGEDVVITQSGVPVARITAIHERGRGRFGQDGGRLTVPDDFDAPLSDDVLNTFEQ